MAEGIRPEETAQPSERIQNYRKEAQSLVKQGGEQPRFEFKRAASLRRENLEDRFSLIKLLQGLANAEIDGERCVVIGADAKQKTGQDLGRVFHDHYHSYGLLMDSFESVTANVVKKVA